MRSFIASLEKKAYFIKRLFGKYLCEFKFSKNIITSTAVDDVKEKINRLVVPKNFSVRSVLVHVNGVSDAVLGAGFFSEVINFGEFLE